MGKVTEKVKTVLRNWLRIQPAMNNSITIREPLSFQATAIRNQIWYRGDASELDQLYKSLGSMDSVSSTRFWAANVTKYKIRNIHS